jgi:hypothetical protein
MPCGASGLAMGCHVGELLSEPQPDLAAANRAASLPMRAEAPADTPAPILRSGTPCQSC